MSITAKIKRRISNYGFRGIIARSPKFLYSRLKKLRNYPSLFSRFGISKKRWLQFQKSHELNFWENLKNQNPGSILVFKDKFFDTNKKRFNEIKLDFSNGIAVDIGCGPFGGMLPYVNSKYKIGIEPLAHEYKKLYDRNEGILILASMAEEIPLLSNTADACYCINVIDHTTKPYQALAEIFRILKPGGYLAFCVDIGGTKKHPVKIYEKDLDNFFATHGFKIIEKSCSTEKSTWGKEADVPLYVFQGYKK